MKTDTKFFLRFIYTLFLVFTCLSSLIFWLYLVVKGYVKNDFYSALLVTPIGFFGGFLGSLLFSGKFYQNKWWMPKSLWITRKDVVGNLLADNYE